jgi:hypothetical protein
VTSTKTATQAKIAEVKEQVQEGWDRMVFAKWLASIVEELLMLAIDNMVSDQWVAINVAPDSAMADQEAEAINQTFMKLTSQKLADAANGMEFDLDIDMESLSPVTEEERFQKLMQAITFIGNPQYAMVFSAVPQLLKIVLKYMGIRSGTELALIQQGLQAVVQMQMQAAQAGAAPGPGVSGQPGSGAPGQPSPEAQLGTPGGPQPGGPAGPGASVPSQ